MAQTDNIAHRASALKQQNKKHNKLGHRTKGQITSLCKGRVNVVSLKRSNKNILSKEQRRNQAKQLQSQKREDTLNKKRFLGTSTKPPFLVCIVPMDDDIDTKQVLLDISNSDDIIDSCTSDQNIYHCCCPKLKQRFSFVTPPSNDLFGLLDAAKVCDTILILWKLGPDEISEDKKNIINSLKHQAMPSTVHAVVQNIDLNHKKRIRAERELLITMSSLFLERSKIFSLAKTQEMFLLFRQIGSQKRKEISFRDKRTHIIAEKVQFHTAEEGTIGQLEVEGYVRGKPLSANDLIHIPGMDSFQIQHIYSRRDPHSMMATTRDSASLTISEKWQLLDEPDHELQESLQSTIDLQEDDQLSVCSTKSSDSGTVSDIDNLCEKKNIRIKKVPKGTSDYQAAWILSDDEDEDSDDDDKMSTMSESMAPKNVSLESDDDIDSSSEEEEAMTMTDAGDDYDDQFDFDEEMNDIEKFRAARDDVSFPDEIDTPMDVSAKERFLKYRGLESFRTSPWDVNEDLPDDYGRIFHFPKFHQHKKTILKQEKEGVRPGAYVKVVLKDVPKHFYNDYLANGGPMVIFSMLKYEQKMTVLNVVLKSFTANHHHSIRSKEKLIFHIGITRFSNNPIFSEHTNGTKHKFARFFHPHQTVMATMFAPLAYPPCPVTVYQRRLDGSQVMVASGSVCSVNANRIICKRVVLTGHPFKVNKKSAVIRYMFFKSVDIDWFKAVELRTKRGKKGHIMEALGTHGHMKCKFNGQIQSQDTVEMKLYKRVFPKWTFDPHVDRPGSLIEPKNPILQSGGLFDDTESRLKKKVRFF